MESRLRHIIGVVLVIGLCLAGQATLANAGSATTDRQTDPGTPASEPTMAPTNDATSVATSITEPASDSTTEPTSSAGATATATATATDAPAATVAPTTNPSPASSDSRPLRAAAVTPAAVAITLYVSVDDFRLVPVGTRVVVTDTDTGANVLDATVATSSNMSFSRQLDPVTVGHTLRIVVTGPNLVDSTTTHVITGSDQAISVLVQPADNPVVPDITITTDPLAVAIQPGTETTLSVRVAGQSTRIVFPNVMFTGNFPYLHANGDTGCTGAFGANCTTAFLTYPPPDNGEISIFLENDSNGVFDVTASFTLRVPADAPDGDYSLTFTSQDPPASTTANIHVGAEVPPTPTSTVLSTATTSPTEVPTTIPTETPTNVPTVTMTPAGTATGLPTETPTAVTAPTDAPTRTATPTSEPVATDTPVATIAVTSTPSMTATPASTATATAASTATGVPAQTPTPMMTGQVALTITTVDGGDVPDTAIVCFDDQCAPIGDQTVASVVSGSTLRYTLPTGSYGVQVSSAAPYADAAGTVDVVADTTTPLRLRLGLRTSPTEPEGSVPGASQTATPTSGAGMDHGSGGSGPSSSDGTMTGGASGHPATTATLPDTGVGSTPRSMNLTGVVLAAVIAMLLAVVGWRWRRPTMSRR